MSSIDLFLLGLLKEKPQGAYGIAREMEFRKLREWAKVSEPAVYKNLARLYRNGFLDAEKVREGEMPEKRVYRINPKGDALFLKLMDTYAIEPGKFYLEANLAIGNLDKIPRARAISYMKRLHDSYSAIRTHLEKEEIPAKKNLPLPARMILKQQHLLFRTMEKWTAEYLGILTRNSR
jgi:DNA-binding PadR family transcriptional regulator